MAELVCPEPMASGGLEARLSEEFCRILCCLLLALTRGRVGQPCKHSANEMESSNSSFSQEGEDCGPV